MGTASADSAATWRQRWLDRARSLDRRIVWAVLIAQWLSFLLCVTGITSGVLASRSINAPATQSLLNYALLAAVCGALHVRAEGWRLRNKWWTYLVLAALDVQGNFLVTKAYQYTSITSVTLLDCFTIPAVMALSWLVFRAKFGAQHLVGASLCVVGLAVLVLTDSASETGGRQPLLGDLLVILGACVYAVCNVAQERLLASTSRWELLAMLGCWGTLIGGVQAAALEHGAWAGSEWDGAAVGALLGFAAALFCFYTLVPTVLMWGGSTVLNLSLLTSDLWAAGARAVMFGGFGGTGGFFALALLSEAAGIVTYTLAGSTHSAAAAAAAAGADADGPTGTGRGRAAAADAEEGRAGGAKGAQEEDEEEEEEEEEEGERVGLLAPGEAGRKLGGGARRGGGRGERLSGEEGDERTRLLLAPGGESGLSGPAPGVDGMSSGHSPSSARSGSLASPGGSGYYSFAAGPAAGAGGREQHSS